MEAGINNHLKGIAAELFIKRDSAERNKINISIDNIFNKLEDYFHDTINELKVFGSYTRDTILPRAFDPHSDIDILIQFNTGEYQKLKPESYRSHLKKFSEIHYPNSLIAKDHPSVVIELHHIKFDLVPSIFDEGWIYDSIEIPDKDGGWQETNPDKFDKKVTKANKEYNSIVKPIIRLLKYWNATHGYPFFSYELESAVAEMDFNWDNYESGFLYAIKELSVYDFPDWAEKKVDALKDNGKWIREYLTRDNIGKAKEVVSRILPGF